MSQIIDLENITKEEIIQLAIENPEIKNLFESIESISNRDISALRAVLRMYFVLNNEVGAFYDENGF